MDIATIIGWLLSIGAVGLLIVDQDQIQIKLHQSLVIDKGT